MLESFSYVREKSTGLFTTTLLGEEVDGQGNRIPVTLARIGAATITLQNEADGTYINTRSPGVSPGAKFTIVSTPGTVLSSSDITIDPTTGALAWRWMPGDTTVADPDGIIDVAEYLATIEIDHADVATPTVFDRKIFAQHRLRIPLRPPLCVPADVFRQLGWKNSEQNLPFIEFACEAITDRFERSVLTSVRKRQETKVFHVFDQCTWSLNLPRWPVDSIVSVKESPTGDFSSATPLVTTEYVLPDEGLWGFLRLRDRPFSKGDVEVTFVGGIARSAGDVPQVLREKCAKQVAFYAQHMDQIGVTSVSSNNATVQFDLPADMMKDVSATWDLFRRIL